MAKTSRVRHLEDRWIRPRHLWLLIPDLLWGIIVTVYFISISLMIPRMGGRITNNSGTYWLLRAHKLCYKNGQQALLVDGIIYSILLTMKLPCVLSLYIVPMIVAIYFCFHSFFFFFFFSHSHENKETTVAKPLWYCSAEKGLLLLTWPFSNA